MADAAISGAFDRRTHGDNEQLPGPGRYMRAKHLGRIGVPDLEADFAEVTHGQWRGLVRRNVRVAPVEELPELGGCSRVVTRLGDRSHEHRPPRWQVIEKYIELTQTTDDLVDGSLFHARRQDLGAVRESDDRVARATMFLRVSGESFPIAETSLGDGDRGVPDHGVVRVDPLPSLQGEAVAFGKGFLRFFAPPM